MLFIYDLWEVTGELTDEPAPRHPMSSALPDKSGGDASRDHLPQYTWVSRPAQSEVFCTMPISISLWGLSPTEPQERIGLFIVVFGSQGKLVRYMCELEDLGSPGETVRQGSQAADSMGREHPTFPIRDSSRCWQQSFWWPICTALKYHQRLRMAALAEQRKIKSTGFLKISSCVRISISESPDIKMRCTFRARWPLLSEAVTSCHTTTLDQGCRRLTLIDPHPTS